MNRPFLKWAGGKFKVYDELSKNFPPGKRFIEPFIGAGSVSLNVNYDSIIVNDFNTDLYLVWSALKEHGLKFIDDCEKMFGGHNNNRSSFDSLKLEFNTTQDKYRKSVLFMYLNRHCFNGLCRYNLAGGFNVPFGLYDSPYFPRKEMENILNHIGSFEFYNQDFRCILEMAGQGDVVYCDPPYMPVSDTSNFDSYTSGGFLLQDHIDLARMSREAADRGATVVVSNCYNWYTKQLYQNMYGASIKKISVARTISSKATERKPVYEVVAVFK